MNVTAVMDGNSTSGTFGQVVERYAYDPYGRVSVAKLLNGPADKDSGVSDWSADADGVSDVDSAILFCGYWRDTETGLYHIRRRMYHPLLGLWLQRDPLGYVDGMSLYEYGAGGPTGCVDAMGFGKAKVVLICAKLVRTAGGRVVRRRLVRISEETARKLAGLARHPNRIGPVVYAESKTGARKLAKGFGKVVDHGDHFHAGVAGATHFSWGNLFVAIIPGSEAIDVLEALYEAADALYTSALNEGRANWQAKVAKRTGLSLEEVKVVYGDWDFETRKQEAERLEKEEHEKLCEAKVRELVDVTEKSREEANKYYGWAMYDWLNYNEEQGDYNWSQYQKHATEYSDNRERLRAYLGGADDDEVKPDE